MPWDTTGTRIDLSENNIKENTTLQLVRQPDTEGVDTTAEGGGFFVLLTRTRTIKRWKLVGLTEDAAKSIALGYAADTVTNYIEASANRANNANGWEAVASTDSYGNWEVV